MFEADVEAAMLVLIKGELKPESLDWILEQGEKVRAGASAGQLSRIFAQVPRYASKHIISHAVLLEKGFSNQIVELLQDWTVDTLCRVWVLLQIPGHDKSNYLKNIDALFETAEMNELVALYNALPLLNYPEYLIKRCEEGIRSNIGLVLEAIIYHNTYPAAWLNEAAWNQLVLKAFFTEKDVNKIHQLEARMNPALISTLEDYVKERQAAGRTVDPQLYKLINITA